MCYMDTDGFLVYIKRWYKDILKNVETKFDFSSNELERALTKGKNKNVIGLRKDRLVGKNLKEFIGSGAKAYSYVLNDGCEDKKSKRNKKVLYKETVQRN